MIGLVLVTHGRLADEFKAALEHVMGPQKQIEAVTIGAEDDSDLCRSDIIEAVNRVDSGDGVAILTQKFDTLAKIPEVKVPVLIAHGTNDSIVPFHMGEQLYQAARAPKRFIRVEGAGHHNLSGAAFNEYRSAIAELFGLKPAKL